MEEIEIMEEIELDDKEQDQKAVELFELPEDLKYVLEMKDCSNFNEDKYYLTQDMEGIFKDIMALRTTISELHQMGLGYLNSTLLHGVPGTGKTFFAEYCAYKFRLPFVKINFAEILTGGVLGETSKTLVKVFRFIADHECIFCLDEIDCIAIGRGKESNATGGELSRITITLMQELDYYKDHQNKSIIIGCTNRRDLLDAALLSRFSIDHEVKALTVNDKKRYMAGFLETYGIDYDKEEVKAYCDHNPQLTQRNVEQDMIRCIANYIKDGKKEYHLKHYEILES